MTVIEAHSSSVYRAASAKSKRHSAHRLHFDQIQRRVQNFVLWDHRAPLGTLHPPAQRASRPGIQVLPTVAAVRSFELSSFSPRCPLQALVAQRAVLDGDDNLAFPEGRTASAEDTALFAFLLLPTPLAMALFSFSGPRVRGGWFPCVCATTPVGNTYNKTTTTTGAHSVHAPATTRRTLACKSCSRARTEPTRQGSRPPSPKGGSENAVRRACQAQVVPQRKHQQQSLWCGPCFQLRHHHIRNY